MLKKGGYTLYGTIGACQVKDMSKLDFSSNDKAYYSLVPKSDQDIAIYVPADGPRVKMREIMARQEAERFMLALPPVEGKQYADDKERFQVCRQILGPGDCTQLASMIKEMSEMEQNRRGKGEPLPIRERDGVKSARKLLFGELTTALDICPEEIPDCTTSQIGGT